MLIKKIELMLSVNALTKTALMIVACAFLFAAVTSDVTAQQKPKRLQKPQIKIISCKADDEDCFIQAAETCRKANVTITKSIDLFGMFTTTGTSYQEIKGGRNGNCTIYFRTEKVDVKFTEEFIRKMKVKGATQQQIEQAELKANKNADLTEGMDGVCIYKTETLVALLKKWKDGNFSTSDWKGGNCRGTMFDQTVRIIEQ